jgi:hypothetical protein
MTDPMSSPRRAPFTSRAAAAVFAVLLGVAVVLPGCQCSDKPDIGPVEDEEQSHRIAPAPDRPGTDSPAALRIKRV